MKKVEVIWIDIEELSGGWHTLDEMEKFIVEAKSRTVSQVAYLYEEDEMQIVIVDSFDREEGDKICYGTINVIPRGCIQSVTELQSHS